MPKKALPTARMRRLGAELAELREADETRTVGVVAERTGLSRTSVERIEKGEQRPQPRTMRDLLDMYGLTDEARREVLLDLAKPTKQRAWFHAYVDDLPESYSAYISFESETALIRRFETSIIPGLLQTAEYAEAVISAGLLDADKDDVDRRVRVRMQRQELLSMPNDPLRLFAIIDEAAIRHVVGGREVMVAQLRALRDAMDRPNIDLLVIPFSAGAHAGMAGPFTIMEFRDAATPPLVYVDTSAGDRFDDDTDAYRRHLNTFERLQGSAHDPTATAKLIDAVRRTTK